MTRRWRTVVGAGLGAALFAGACSGGQSGGEVTTNEPPPDQGGQGQRECEVAEDCREKAENRLTLFTTVQEADVRLDASQCEVQGFIVDSGSFTGPTCECRGGDRSYVLGPAGLGCYVVGRTGNCLFDDTEFTSCDVIDDSACEAPCAELERRVNADIERTVDAELVEFACVATYCRTVLALDGQCFVDNDYEYLDRAYDCALGGEAILAQQDSESTQPSTPQTTPVDTVSAYPEGSSAWVELRASSEHWGGTETARYFGVGAQFYDVIPPGPPPTAVVSDPLEGLDDCGVRGFLDGGAFPEFRNVERAVLHDGDQEHVLEEFDPGSGFYSYGFDLAAAGLDPSVQRSYSFSASGGSFAASIEVPDLVLPEPLSVTTLETAARFDKGALTLTWTGQSAEPLTLQLWIRPRLADYGEPYGIECRMVDDGSFTIPESVLAAAPDGIVSAELRRDRRALVASNGRRISSVVGVLAQHHFALGPACDRQDVMQACLDSAEQQLAAYAECGIEPPALASLCPSYLSESCLGCPEYFECVARVTRCEAQGLTRDSSCSCPQ
ncbi:MAG: hypothetical protein ABW217_20480 [Polyangiaceae bacterium]